MLWRSLGTSLSRILPCYKSWIRYSARRRRRNKELRQRRFIALRSPARCREDRRTSFARFKKAFHVISTYYSRIFLHILTHTYIPSTSILSRQVSVLTAFCCVFDFMNEYIDEKAVRSSFFFQEKASSKQHNRLSRGPIRLWLWGLKSYPKQALSIRKTCGNRCQYLLGPRKVSHRNLKSYRPVSELYDTRTFVVLWSTIYHCLCYSDIECTSSWIHTTNF